MFSSPASCSFLFASHFLCIVVTIKQPHADSWSRVCGVKSKMTKATIQSSARKIALPVARLLPFVHANKSVRETLVALHEQGIKIGKTKLHQLMKPLRAKWCAAANLKVRPPKKLTQRDQRRICKLVRVDRLRRKAQIFRGLRSLGYDSSYQTVRRE